MEEVNEQPDAATAEAEPLQQTPDDLEFWKSKSRDWEKRAKENSGAAKRLAEIEESQKTEAQRLTDALEAEKRRAADAEQTLIRYRVATAKNLRPELVDRLRGTTEDELAEDAERLLALTAPPAAPPSFDGGPRGQSPEPGDWNSTLRRAAGKST